MNKAASRRISGSRHFKRALAALLLPALIGAAGAQEWTVEVKAVNGRISYSHEQPCPVGEQATFTGRPRMRGPGEPVEMIFNSLLNRPQDGLFRLDYQVELAGKNGGRPPFQAAGKALLRPGKPVLAAEAGGWKFFLKLHGKAARKYPQKKSGTLETRLKCGRVSYPANFAYLPGEQYSTVIYKEEEERVTRFTAGLLPNHPAVDGTFLLQYALLLKEGGETLSEGQGELILAPGGARQTVAAGKDCVFSARALR